MGSATGVGDREGVGPGGRRDPAVGRIAYWDWYRAVMILAMISLHAAMCYMAFAPGWWYVIDPEKSLGFTAWVLVSDTFVMPAMFFAAGYFAPGSLFRRGAGAFLREKAIRIGIPWIVGVLLFAPLFARASLVSLKIPLPPTYGEFVRTLWLGPAYQQGHFWFLGVLLAFFLLLVPLAGAFRRPEAAVAAPAGRRILWTLGLWLAASAAFVLSSYWKPVDSWIPVLVIYFQPARLVLHLGAFLLGALAWRDRWFDGPEPGAGCLVLWGALAAGAAAGILLVKLGFPQREALALRAAEALCQCGAGVAISAFALFLCRAWGSRPSRMGHLLGETSYGTYWLHQMILMPFAALLVPTGLPILLKFLLILFGTYALCTLLSEGILRRAPLLRRMF